jgi:hypothetical protein
MVAEKGADMLKQDAQTALKAAAWALILWGMGGRAESGF